MKMIGSTTMKMTPDLRIYLDNNMNEIDAASHMHVDWMEILKFIGYGLFAALIWVLKRFGEDHLSSIKELAVELREMRKELNALASRVTAVEIRTGGMTHHD